MSQAPEDLRPRLRMVETHPVQTEDGLLIALRDPLLIAENPLVVTLGAALVLEQLDGTNTLQDIQTSIFKASGQLLPMPQIEELVGTLDREFYLRNERFDAAYKEARERYLALPTRPSILAGAAFPDDPDELHTLLDSFFDGDRGPGRPTPGAGPFDLRAIVAPHIDLQRGGHSFAHAYKALVERSDADLFIILGIAHSGDGRPFALTDKDFETPFGVMPTDREFVKRLGEFAPEGALGDEMIHSREHSAEFQALFLRYLFPDRDDVAMVPILCGGMYEAFSENTPPAESPEVAGFVDALRRTIEESGKKTCIIAGVDFAHVGPRFGDEEPVDAATLARLEREDNELIADVAARAQGSFFQRLQRTANGNNVCGYPALVTLLALLDAEGAGVEGTLLSYEQSVEEDTGSVVTFAAMSFP